MFWVWIEKKAHDIQLSDGFWNLPSEKVLQKALIQRQQNWQKHCDYPQLNQNQEVFINR